MEKYGFGPNFKFCHKVSTFITVQICQDSLNEFLFLKAVDSTSMDVAICHVLESKDEGPASVNSKTIKTDEQGLFPIFQHNGKDVA